VGRLDDVVVRPVPLLMTDLAATQAMAAAVLDLAAELAADITGARG
jgi:hypothetical protein